MLNDSFAGFEVHLGSLDSDNDPAFFTPLIFE
jgi:hypothetical protein